MIDRSFIGHVQPATVWTVEAGRLRAFAKAIGETREEYFTAAGAHPAAPGSPLAPPTMAFSAELDTGSTRALLETLGVDSANAAHAEQSFNYHRAVYAGDVLRLQSRVIDIVAWRGGELEFITQSTTVTNQRGERVLDMTSVIVVRNTN